MLLLFATFLAVPFAAVVRALRDWRFLAAVLVANFVVLPAAVFGLSRFVADDQGLLVGLLLVLLTPCVDYVIVFTRLARGAQATLLAATPVLMIVQLAMLPAYLTLFAGIEVVSVVDVGAFVEAFLWFVALPLLAAALVQALARRHPVARGVERTMAATMVPLMAATLAVVVGSQVAAVGGMSAHLVRLVPVYVAFALVATVIGIAAGRVARLDAPAVRAVALSTVTRNSLVVLPLALALPARLSLAPLAVVTQTLVELVVLVVLVRVLPRIVR